MSKYTLSKWLETFMMQNDRLRIIVTGMVAQYPVGGVAWDYLQYVIGLARLGHDVYYHEDSWSWPYDPVKKTASPDGTYSARFLDRFFQRYAPELKHSWHYSHLHEKSYGMTAEAFSEVAASADLFINVSGASAIPDELSGTCLKIFVDSDPGYNQIMLLEKFEWSENAERWCEQVAIHDCYFSYGEAIGGSKCLVPDAGFRWQPTRMPVVLDLWDTGEQESKELGRDWTTVMTWNNFAGRVTYQGTEYKSKGAEFEKIIDLPSKVRASFLVAVGGKGAPTARLSSHGWRVKDGPAATRSPEMYQDFIRKSRGEVSTAKHIYVALQTGWFSCRSACYLAAGRPAVLQNTGFSQFIPCGRGLMAFESLHQAAEMVSMVEQDYAAHSTAARDIAANYFDSNTVLVDLINDAFAAKAGGAALN